MSVHRLSSLLLPGLFLVAAPALAATGGASLPWDAPLMAVVDNFRGPMARAGILAAAAVAGYVWMFSEHGSGGKKLSQLVLGGSLVFFCADFLAAIGLDGAIC